MDRVLVTGAAGFIGGHTARYLIERGYSVRATDLPGKFVHDLVGSGCETIEGNLLDRGFAESVVEGMEGVLHLAAAFDLSLPPRQLVETNLGLTRVLGRAASSAGVGRFIQFSTGDVYGTKYYYPISEKAITRPINGYAVSKLLSELEAFGLMKEKGLPVASVRPPFVYGPGAVYTAGAFVALPCLMARRIGSIKLPAGGPMVDTVHVRDVAQALAVLLEAESVEGMAFNLADDSGLSGGDFLRLTYEPFGIEVSGQFELPWKMIEVLGRTLWKLPPKLYDWLNGMLAGWWEVVVREEGLIPALTPRLDRDFACFLWGHHCYTNDRLKSLGWKPEYPSYREGWPETVEWYRRERWIA